MPNRVPAPRALDTTPLQVWLITDDKPGHRNQLEGLRQALQRQATIDAHWLSAPSRWQALRDALSRRFAAGQALPPPDLILVAGHRTHWAGLAARRAYGGRLVCLMRPSLPADWFDACIVPLHDEAPRRGHCVRTLGVLNPMRPGPKTPGSCAVLIGGHSRHFGWDDDAILWALSELVQRWPTLQLTDSRRTPASLRPRLAEFALRHGIAYQPWDRCPPGWLADTLAHSESAWITADSVSMVYEALTAGCATGLIELPPAPGRSAAGKVVRGLEGLIDTQRLTRLSAFLAQHSPLHPASPPLAEADQVAAHLLARWHWARSTPTDSPDTPLLNP